MVKERLTELKVWIVEPPVVVSRMEQDTEGKTKKVDVTNLYERGWVDSEHFKWLVPNGNYVIEQGIGKAVKAQWAEVRDGDVSVSVAPLPDAPKAKPSTAKAAKKAAKKPETKTEVKTETKSKDK
jgi:hypothetical protein